MTPEQLLQVVLTSAAIASVVSGFFAVGSVLLQRHLAREDAKTERMRQRMVDRLNDTRAMVRATSEWWTAFALGGDESFSAANERVQRRHFPLADIALVGDEGVVRIWLGTMQQILDLGRRGGDLDTVARLVSDTEYQCIQGLEAQLERALRDEPLRRISPRLVAESAAMTVRRLSTD